MKNRITAALVALGMCLGVGAPLAAAYTSYGITATPKAATLWGSQVLGTFSYNGTATASFAGQSRLLKNGVQQGSTNGFSFTKGVYYSGTGSILRNCSPGTWVTQVKLGGGSWHSSPGKYISCI